MVKTLQQQGQQPAGRQLLLGFGQWPQTLQQKLRGGLLEDQMQGTPAWKPQGAEQGGAGHGNDAAAGPSPVPPAVPSGGRHPQALAGSATIQPRTASMTTEPRRPAWLNWLILAAFLWSSWQLAGLWFERLHGS